MKIGENKLLENSGLRNDAIGRQVVESHRLSRLERGEASGGLARVGAAAPGATVPFTFLFQSAFFHPLLAIVSHDTFVPQNLGLINFNSSCPWLIQ